MANELTISANLAFAKNLISGQLGVNGLQANVSGTKLLENTQTVATTATALNVGDLSTPGYLLLINTDATNYVTIRSGSGGADVVQLLPGDVCLFRLATATPYAIANTAPCIIQYLLIET